MIEMQRMRLQDLAVVHQAAQLLGSRREMARPDDHVERLGGRKVMADRTDAAQPLHHHRHFPVGSALDELLEAAELDDVQPDLVHMVVLVEQQRDLAVAFDARDRIDRDAPQIIGTECRFEVGSHGHPQSNWIIRCASIGSRPAIRSVSTCQIASADGGQPGTK